ncbi:NAD(P)-binding domain-containing protein [Georgenia sp. Z1344]|uniref:NAD(P)-binding domain-containing protein n=1 Tax=Georgenia sp. Z1344 TaxID=3416706 RepID=UPI003CE97774
MDGPATHPDRGAPEAVRPSDPDELGATAVASGEDVDVDDGAGALRDDGVLRQDRDDEPLRDGGGERWGEYVGSREPRPGPTGWVPVLSPTGDPDGERLTVRPRRLPGDLGVDGATDENGHPMDRGREDAREVDVVVIGAGQAGLSTANRLLRRGFVGYSGDPAEQVGAPRHRGDVRDFVVLDAEDGPGGAWRHRWPTLTMATVNGIHDLPGAGFPQPDPREPAATALPRYFATYEDMFDLPVLRPVVVTSVERVDDDPRGRLLVRTDHGSWAARAVISATGTWSRPFWPSIPGSETFRGRQLHTHDYEGPEDLEGERVAIVGGGISGVGHVLEIARVAETFWYTRTPPRWKTDMFDQDAGRGVEERVAARVEQGLRPLPVVAETGLFLGPATQRAIDAGILERRPMFGSMTTRGVVEADGTVTPVDTIVWATGFRHELRHLRPLRIRTRDGGVLVRGTAVVDEPRLHLVGYGPAASTIGATRAGRRAVAAIVELLDG